MPEPKWVRFFFSASLARIPSQFSLESQLQRYLERARRALSRSDRPETIAFHRINREAKMSGIEQIVAL